jgi:hypothetical protein
MSGFGSLKDCQEGGVGAQARAGAGSESLAGDERWFDVVRAFGSSDRPSGSEVRSVERSESQSLYENFRDMLRKDDDFGLFSSAEVRRNTILSSLPVC